MGTAGIDPRTGLLGQFPGGSVFQQGRIKGPQGADTWFGRMDATTALLIKEDAKAIRTGLDRYLAVPLVTVLLNQCLPVQAKKLTDPFDLVLLDIDPAFTITALAAPLAFKGFHL